MSQIGRNLTDAVDGILNGKRYLIHDRDPLFTTEFLNMVADVEVKSVTNTGRTEAKLVKVERAILEGTHGQASNTSWATFMNVNTVRSVARLHPRKREL
jgi:hypothetical protein